MRVKFFARKFLSQSTAEKCLRAKMWTVRDSFIRLSQIFNKYSFFTINQNKSNDSV